MFIGRLAQSLALGKDDAQAAQVGDALAAAAGADDGSLLYYSALVYALSAGVARDKSTDDSQELAERYAAMAVALLKRAAAADWFQHDKNRISLKNESAFEPLRNRDDYDAVIQQFDRDRGTDP